MDTAPALLIWEKCMRTPLSERYGFGEFRNARQPQSCAHQTFMHPASCLEMIIHGMHHDQQRLISGILQRMP
jgi:hypothetical protein